MVSEAMSARWKAGHIPTTEAHEDGNKQKKNKNEVHTYREVRR